MKKTTISSKLDSNIDLLRHVFAIAVILIHMHSQTRYTEETNQHLSVIVNYIDGAVLGFFFISGYLFKYQEYVYDYAKKQFFRLMTPFFIFSLIYTFLLALIDKITIVEGLKQTIFLHGVGMQLYFLPFLMLITILYAYFSKKSVSLNQTYFNFLLVIIVLVFSIMNPTSESTGSNPQMLWIYSLGFLLGRLFSTYIGSSSRLGLGTGLLCLIIGFIDPRFYDLAIVVMLFTIINNCQIRQSRRLPGSGGVYLLHTPIVNFFISVLLVKVGIHQELNIFVSVILTYGFCLLLTLFVVRKFPQKKWLLLE